MADVPIDECWMRFVLQPARGGLCVFVRVCVYVREKARKS